MSSRAGIMNEDLPELLQLWKEYKTACDESKAVIMSKKKKEARNVERAIMLDGTMAPLPVVGGEEMHDDADVDVHETGDDSESFEEMDYGEDGGTPTQGQYMLEPEAADAVVALNVDAEAVDVMEPDVVDAAASKTSAVRRQQLT